MRFGAIVPPDFGSSRLVLLPEVAAALAPAEIQEFEKWMSS